MCRSPLPNSSQPSETRCRVGRRPTRRSLSRRSENGQPWRTPGSGHVRAGGCGQAGENERCVGHLRDQGTGTFDHRQRRPDLQLRHGLRRRDIASRRGIPTKPGRPPPPALSTRLRLAGGFATAGLDAMRPCANEGAGCGRNPAPPLFRAGAQSLPASGFPSSGGTLDAERTTYGMARQSSLHLRRAPRLRTRRAVRAGQRAAAAAADADVRPHRLDRRGRRRARQGPCPRRARRAPGPLVLPLPLQGRSGDAGLPRGRRPVADGRLLPRLARLAGPRPGARRRRGEVRRPGAADASRRWSTASTSSASSARSWCSASPTAGSRPTAGASTRPRTCGSACSRPTGAAGG